MPTYNAIVKEINRAVKKFNKAIPAAQRGMYDAVIEEVNRLDLTPDARIKVTVKNLGILNSIKNKIARIILTPEYTQEVKDFAKAFNAITSLSNEYWKSVESKFKPRPLLKQIRVQAVDKVVAGLTEAGIHANVSDRVIDVLKTNITTGGSYKDMAGQIREGLLNTEQKGYLDRYARQVTTDALNQYAATYNQVVSSDLGFEWYKYSGSDIETTRCFCDAMTDQPYFHISEVPALLRGEGLQCTDKNTGQKVPVKINPKTKLPYGMVPNTDAGNFQVYRGGYNCGHQVRPLDEDLVPPEVVARVKATAAYKAWVKANKPDKK